MMPNERPYPRQPNKASDADTLGVLETGLPHLLEERQSAGVRIGQVAEEIGMSRTTLWRRRIRLGISWSPQHKVRIAQALGSDADDATAIIEWLAKDPERTIKGLAQELGVHRRTLHNRLAEGYRAHRKPHR